jgi:hypothetical protein
MVYGWMVVYETPYRISLRISTLVETSALLYPGSTLLNIVYPSIIV